MVIKLLIILYGRRANIYEDRRAKSNRAIVSIRAEKALAYRDNIFTKKKKGHILIAKSLDRYIENTSFIHFIYLFLSYNLYILRVMNIS